METTTELKNVQGRKLGSLVDRGHEVEARDVRGTKLGVYDRATNETRDVRGAKVGTGDTTAALVVAADPEAFQTGR